MSNNNKPGAAATPPMSNAERVAAWKERHKPKRKVAEIPHDMAEAFENKLKEDRIKYQPWLLEQIQRYLRKY